MKQHWYLVSYIADKGSEKITGHTEFGITSTWRPGIARSFTDGLESKDLENVIIISIFYMGSDEK